VFAAIVVFLVVQGLPLLTAFLCVYAVAIGYMLSVQRGALQDTDSEQFERVMDDDKNSWPIAGSEPLRLGRDQRH